MTHITNDKPSTVCKDCGYQVLYRGMLEKLSREIKACRSQFKGVKEIKVARVRDGRGKEEWRAVRGQTP